jgi:hypothetical protein
MRPVQRLGHVPRARRGRRHGHVPWRGEGGLSSRLCERRGSARLREGDGCGGLQVGFGIGDLLFAGTAQMELGTFFSLLLMVVLVH